MGTRRKLKVGKTKVVALLIETSNAYSRGLLAGIRSWVHEKGGWSIHLTELGRGNQPPSWLPCWHGHGIIARIENKDIESAVRKTGVPVVNVSATDLAPEYPAVISDSAAMALLAANHLLERGFRRFGYLGESRFKWSERHGVNFGAFLAEKGYSCSYYPVSKENRDDWETERDLLSQWLKEQAKPIGMMACYDIRGQMLLEACKHAGLLVPDEVAVIGQHNDEILCDLSDPPLSSVIPNAPRAGYEAAGILDGLMKKKKGLLKKGATLIPPIGVATRQSTDIVAVEDQSIATAIRFIRENACTPIGVRDVLKKIPLSRTLFERQFKKLVGRAPYEEIIRTRMDRARLLLATTDLTLTQIAEKCAFASAEYLNAAFKKHQGMPPGRFRQLEKGRG